ncbi:hypothetical protein BDQ17DRAFT_1229023 [Cyathus striatus]|nr:hypothetical protein BDQ17DRAFT_1229023 [Cyathus striatus]
MSLGVPPRLVYDLIPVVLGSDNHWWPLDYVRLSTVSKEWLVHVRRKLYSCPLLLSFRACSLLARTLRERPNLVQLVQGLHLQPIYRAENEGRALAASERADLRYLLELEGLRSVKLGGYLSIRAERFLNLMANADTLEELHIDGSLLHESAGTFSPSLEWDEYTTYRFPNLKKLRLANLELDIVAPYPSQLAQCPLLLTELTLENVDISSGYLSSILRDSSQLKILNISAKTASDFGEQLGLVLSTCCIDTVRYEVQEDCFAGHTIFGLDAAAMTSMRCLDLKGLNMDEDLLGYIGSCCRKLERLTIAGRTIHVCAGGWVRFLDSGALPSLCWLGIPEGTSVPPFKHGMGRKWSCCIRQHRDEELVCNCQQVV